MEKKERKKRNSKLTAPTSIDEARKMGRVKAVHMAPLYGMSPDMLRRRCVKSEVPESVKLGREWWVTCDGMDALFQPRKGRR